MTDCYETKKSYIYSELTFIMRGSCFSKIKLIKGSSTKKKIIIIILTRVVLFASYKTFIFLIMNI